MALLLAFDFATARYIDADFATSSSIDASSYWTFSTDPGHHITSPRVNLDIVYDPQSISRTPTAPEDLYNAILSLGVSHTKGEVAQ